MKLNNNRKRQILLVIILILIVGVLLFIYMQKTSSYEEKKFYGTWRSETGYFEYIFYSNESCKIQDTWASWEIKNEKIIITFHGENRINTSDYTFSNDDNILTIAGMKFIKQ